LVRAGFLFLKTIKKIITIDNGKKAMNQAQKIIDTHLLKTFFSINLIEQGMKKITLKLTSKGIADGQSGVLGCIFDYSAQIVGYKTLGQCAISECEINIHTESQANNLIVNASIAATNTQYATYHCEIYSVNQSSNLLLAESHGTLKKVTVKHPSSTLARVI
jgi:hypothetical protein